MARIKVIFSRTRKMNCRKTVELKTSNKIDADLGAMAMKGCSAFPKAPSSQESDYQIV